MPAIIVLGDKTDHGGEVIEAAGTTDTHGKRMARVGDQVYCPKKGHNDAVIVTGDPTFIIDGKAVAYHGCKTSCGATLISSQAVSTIDFEGGGSAQSTAYLRSQTSTMAKDETEQLPYDERIAAVDSQTGTAIPGLAYFVRTSSGKTFKGFTDDAGLVPRISTDNEEALTVWFGIAALHMEERANG